MACRWQKNGLQTAGMNPQRHQVLAGVCVAALTRQIWMCSVCPYLPMSDERQTLAASSWGHSISLDTLFCVVARPSTSRSPGFWSSPHLLLLPNSKMDGSQYHTSSYSSALSLGGVTLSKKITKSQQQKREEHTGLRSLTHPDLPSSGSFSASLQEKSCEASL